MEGGSKFDAMRFVTEHPEKVNEVVKAMEEGLPTEGLERKTKAVDSPVPPAKRKHWMRRLEDKEDGIED
jgi:hypothetical protein